MDRKECLRKAQEIVCNDREDAYGKPEDNFESIADLWSAYKDVEFSPKDVAMMMALLKVARIKTGKHKDDSFIDLAGYAACACEVSSKNLKNLFVEVGESFVADVMDGIKGVKRQTHEDFDKPKFRFEDYPGKYVMHCDTKEKAEKFCEILGTSHGLDKLWKIYEKNTCYNFNKEFVGYSYVNFYRNKNYTILEFDDFDWSE